MRALPATHDLTAGAIGAIVALPTCIASGLLAFAPLGPEYAVVGTAAGLCGAIVTCCVSALVATSSFVITTTRVSEALLVAGFGASLLHGTGGRHDAEFVALAMFLCVAGAGVWQTVFGVAGVAKIIKFTPHPVLVGFLNGVSILVVWSQLAPYLQVDPTTSVRLLFQKPWMFVLMVATMALMLAYPAFARRVSLPRIAQLPPVVVAFAFGVLIFYALELVAGADAGPTVGPMRMSFLGPLVALAGGGVGHDLLAIAGPIVSNAAVLAVIATLDALLAFRSAQNVADMRGGPVRDLVGQGIGNLAAGLAGGAAGAASPGSSMAAYRAGGRTRWVPLSCGLLLLALSVGAPQLIAAVPSVVLAGILAATGVLLFDRSSLQLLTHVRKAPSPTARQRALSDLAVMVIVMGITVFYSVVAGVVAGVALAGTIFIVNMSRPVIERVMLGDQVQSKRIRPAHDIEILRDTGPERAVVVLDGVLFFGNADDLYGKVRELQARAEMVTLDMRRVSDIDISGATILANLASKTRAQKKELLFCSVPEALHGVVHGILPKGVAIDSAVHRNLDAALEHMEEVSLQLHAARREGADVLELRDIDFLAGLDSGELEHLAALLTRCEFAAASVICRQGDEGDRMWLLAKGSVSVRLISADARTNLRIASLSRGTTIGEMALVERGRRSATIVADEHVVAFELPRASFDFLLAEHPDIATKLLANLARELARRLRRTSEDLRSQA